MYSIYDCAPVFVLKKEKGGCKEKKENICVWIIYGAESVDVI